MSEQDSGPAAAEGVRRAARELAHRTQPLNRFAGLEYVGDVHGVLGSLYIGTQSLGQVLDQLTAFLEHELQEGRVLVAAGQGRGPTGDAFARVSDAAVDLRKARAAADALTRHMSDAQHVISPVYLPEHEEPG